VADGAERRAADLTDALGDGVGGGENLVCLFVEHQVIVAEVRAAHVPMEVLRLDVERVGVGEDRVERVAMSLRALEPRSVGVVIGALRRSVAAFIDLAMRVCSSRNCRIDLRRTLVRKRRSFQVHASGFLRNGGFDGPGALLRHARSAARCCPESADPRGTFTLGIEAATRGAAETAAPEIELTVVVPTFNESMNVPLLVDRLDAALEGTRWEVVFVDDDSPDGTAKVARDLALRDRRVRVIRRIGRRGLSTACVEGVLSLGRPLLRRHGW